LAELLSFIGKWLNASVSGTTGYAPIERKSKPNIFRNILKEDPERLPAGEALANKLLEAYDKMNLRVERRRRRTKRETGTTERHSQLDDSALVRCQRHKPLKAQPENSSYNSKDRTLSGTLYPQPCMSYTTMMGNREVASEAIPTHRHRD
jgi:hypothetical protein